MIRIAVIGTFWLTETFFKSLEEVPGIALAGVCSRSLDRAKEYVGNRKNVRVYDDPKKLAADPDIHAVYIATPNYTHYELSKLMLSSGKHVLCEKPVCAHLEEFDELTALAKSKKCVFLEAMVNAHLPRLKQLQETLRNAGPVITARLDFSQRSSRIDRVRKGEVFSTFSKASGGGALMDLGVHSISLALLLFGYPKMVYAYSTPILDVDGTDTVILGYDGFHAVLTISKLAESRIRSEIICEYGTITIGLLSRLQEIDYYPTKGYHQLIFGESEFSESLVGELRDFLSYIRGADNTAYKQMQTHSRDCIRLLTEIRGIIGYDI